jgi:hypothetical protein
MAMITAAAIGTAGTIYASKQASKAAKEQNALAREGIEAADPFRKYRPEYAEKLKALTNDPSSVKDTAEYKARMQAAERTMAAQGYTGSGNALVESAEAGGQAYQSAFNNLALLSGASVTPGGGYSAAMQGNQAATDTKLGALGGVTNNLANLALTAGQRFNQAATPKPYTTGVMNPISGTMISGGG